MVFPYPKGSTCFDPLIAKLIYPPISIGVLPRNWMWSYLFCSSSSLMCHLLLETLLEVFGSPIYVVFDSSMSSTNLFEPNLT